MKNYEEILAEACRIEVDNSTNDTYIVFKVKSEKFKQHILTHWTDDIEFSIKDKYLINKP